jgi:Fic family protein
MRKPEMPPTQESLWKKIAPQQLASIVQKVREPTVKGEYLHWDKLQYRTPPQGISIEDWWFGLKLCRSSSRKSIPLKSCSGEKFSYALLEPIAEVLHKIDWDAGGKIEMPEQITNPNTRNRYYVSSLIEEAITSSQLEGAATTRSVAKEMIRSGRNPRDRSEQMILNNFATMQKLSEWKTEILTPDLVFDIHRLIAEHALDDPTAAGRFRRDIPKERVFVGDDYGEIFHEPPSAGQLNARMKVMCDFANGKTPEGFVHPVLRSIILHFWLAYDHPFVDGNGRTARALFYWSMLHNNYWLCEFISISPIILKAPAKYQQAFLYTETDDNDLTYFILYHLEVLQRAIRDLQDYIKRKSAEVRSLDSKLHETTALNYRQRALMAHALRHPDFLYSVESHQRSHAVVYETARRDLLDLAARGLLTKKKIGKTWHFTPVADLESRLAGLS